MSINPFNNKNKLITKNDIQNILKKYGIFQNINNLGIYQEAFIHESYSEPHVFKILERDNLTLQKKLDGVVGLQKKSYERLEYLGDAIIETIISNYLFERYPEEDESFLSRMRISLVKGMNLAHLSRVIGLGKYLIISRTMEERENARMKENILEDIFEAFIGAIFLDFNKIDISDDKGWFENIFVTGPGFQMCQIFIERVFEEYVDWDRLINSDDNYKNRLQVIIQKEFKTTPEYVELEINEEGYTMGIYICLKEKIYNMNIDDAINFNEIKNFQKIHELLEKDNKALIFLTKSTHKIKKKAEQSACEHAIEIINRYNKL